MICTVILNHIHNCFMRNYIYLQCISIALRFYGLNKVKEWRGCYSILLYKPPKANRAEIILCRRCFHTSIDINKTWVYR